MEERLKKLDERLPSPPLTQIPLRPPGPQRRTRNNFVTRPVISSRTRALRGATYQPVGMTAEEEELLANTSLPTPLVEIQRTRTNLPFRQMLARARIAMSTVPRNQNSFLDTVQSRVNEVFGIQRLTDGPQETVQVSQEEQQAAADDFLSEMLGDDGFDDGTNPGDEGKSDD